MLDESVVVSGELYPTSAQAPDPKQVAKGVLDLRRLETTAHTEAEGPVRLVAECTNCNLSPMAAEQYEDLIIEVRDDAGAEVYRGPLSNLDARLAEPEKTEVRVWLADTGKPQAQGVLTEWSFTATAE